MALETVLRIENEVLPVDEIVVGIADIKAAKGECCIVTYALGSCVGICIYDEVVRVGGMLHAMLPDSTRFLEMDKAERYVDSGLDMLCEIICRMGAVRTRLKAKLVGGAKMFDYLDAPGKVDIGMENVLQARKYLRQLGIELVGEETGGEVARTIRFNPADGSVTIHAANSADRVI